MQITKVDSDRNQNAKQYKLIKYTHFFKVLLFVSKAQHHLNSDKFIGKMFITQPNLSE